MENVNFAVDIYNSLSEQNGQHGIKGQDVLTGSLSACADAVAIERQTSQQKTEVYDTKIGNLFFMN